MSNEIEKLTKEEFDIKYIGTVELQKYLDVNNANLRTLERYNHLPKSIKLFTLHYPRQNKFYLRNEVDFKLLDQRKNATLCRAIGVVEKNGFKLVKRSGK